jgi:hypothetical protein
MVLCRAVVASSVVVSRQTLEKPTTCHSKQFDFLIARAKELAITLILFGKMVSIFGLSQYDFGIGKTGKTFARTGN